MTRSFYKKACVLIVILLSACGSNPVKPISIDTSALVRALLQQDKIQIQQQKDLIGLGTRTSNIINLYLMLLHDNPIGIVNNSEQLITNIHHYSLQQQVVLQKILLWAYAIQIYRHETGQQIRILQTEQLLLAPSNINFGECELLKEHCSVELRNRLGAFVSAQELSETLFIIANNDPCINLTHENLAGDFASQCLASRKGDLKVNLLSRPNFLHGQWVEVLK
ncbi:MAG: hypothetical protein L3J52_02955 [Proteobacteria bacterium]|nr:hypothetical protein [Pseudomonadota bacterium]